ncbi:MAG: glucose-1-phosphate thymidylyltransferase [Bacteroidetes bacterium]|nr:glucose-1-phosphate thymidylyltransferase [Bacteroidota bacterium]
MRYILFEDFSHFTLLPFSFTRPVYHLRTGIFTAKERWEMVMETELGQFAYDYLGPAFSTPVPPQDCIWINGRYCPTPDFLRLLQEIPPMTGFTDHEGTVIAAHFSPNILPDSFDGIIHADLLESMGINLQNSGLNILSFSTLPDLFAQNNEWLAFDFQLVTQRQISESISDPYTRIYGKDNLFISPGVKIKAAIINAEDGPVYFGPNVEIGEGAIIRNSHAFCANSTVGLGAKLRGDTTVGPFSKVGGEVSNSIIMGYSNKGHEGYLGNSVLGYWCNMGADSNTSNLKNNYANVKIWNYQENRFKDTGRQFCGLMMGDHSKCGINTMFNTGTVVGVSANIFGSGFPRAYIPSFSWGGAHGFKTYLPKVAFEVAEKVLARKGLRLEEADKHILNQVFQITAKYRTWEKT